MDDQGTRGAAAGVDLSRRTIARPLWLCTTAVIVLGVAREITAYSNGLPGSRFAWKIFWMNGEGNILSWYSSFVLAVAALLLFLQFRRAASAQDRDTIGWLILALGFLFLSIDETAQLHEQLTLLLRGAASDSGHRQFAWVLVGAPLAFVVGLIFIPFLQRLRADTRWRFILAGLVYLAGTLGLEAIGARLADAAGFESIYYGIAMCTEETFEFIGATLFTTAVLRHLVVERATFELRFG